MCWNTLYRLLAGGILAGHVSGFGIILGEEKRQRKVLDEGIGSGEGWGLGVGEVGGGRW